MQSDGIRLCHGVDGSGLRFIQSLKRLFHRVIAQRPEFSINFEAQVFLKKPYGGNRLKTAFSICAILRQGISQAQQKLLQRNDIGSGLRTRAGTIAVP